jgi:peptidoglycan/LPS O-acetylase OafA/YrhL
MEVFFLLCGFFARLVYQRRGVREFARNRFNRIFIPLGVGWMILYPILVYLWLAGAAKSGHWEPLSIPPEARGLPRWQLTIGFFVGGGVFAKFNLTHLWFLHQLLVLYLLAIPLRAAVHRWLSPALPQRLDALFGRAVRSRWRLLLFLVPTVPVLLTMRSWGVDTPNSSLWPYLPTTALYFGFFVCGWLLHRQTPLLAGFVPGWRRSLLLGAVLVFATEGLGAWVWRHRATGTSLAWLRLLHATLYAGMMWAFVAGVLGLFVDRCPGASRIWRYLADASYWVYLAHLPTVVALQVAVGRWPVHWSLKYPLIVAVAVPVLFLSYHFLVRSTFIGRQLNGRTYPLTLRVGDRT